MNETKSEAEERERKYQELQQHRQTEARSMFEEACSEARERYADFDAVARNPQVPVSQGMADIILGLDSGPDVLYHLGKNPAQAAQIANMPRCKRRWQLAVSKRVWQCPSLSQNQKPPTQSPQFAAPAVLKRPSQDVSD